MFESQGMRGLMCSARATGFARLLRLNQGCLVLPLSVALVARLLRPLSGRSRWLVIPPHYCSPNIREGWGETVLGRFEMGDAGRERDGDGNTFGTACDEKQVPRLQVRSEADGAGFFSWYRGVSFLLDGESSGPRHGTAGCRRPSLRRHMLKRDGVNYVQEQSYLMTMLYHK